MNSKNIYDSNRSAWNEALNYHQKARSNSLQKGFQDLNFTTFDRDCDVVLLEKLDKIDFTDKVIGQLPCNNGRELLSLMKLGAKKAVGFDISDNAIQEAKQLAEIAKIDATFERTNILDINDSYNNYFDFIYISEGSLQWFPDLNEYFAVVSRLLKKGGQLLIFEMHPIAYLFEVDFDAKSPDFDLLVPYFKKGPYHYKDGLDYVGGVEYESKEGYWFMHKLSDILKALITNGLTLEYIEEYNLEMANNESTKVLDKFPLSYMVAGMKA
ncbi:class I SAM-dependent methyltransferase [Candidatus Enterococcus ferrettii]|uniref:Methyltransferase domain-containing protein n=1 Tax=Candidatus Enterococcus ferrettii TaxID=2815324 RepID=A0ABV0EPP0_9ENTE|nr:class I SAM-dependent methyltransferase [Enterococcus sp. 665A]MBO1338913.1 class I SAM-dependent methyltransferase [Enterococcus sp. 665A]